MPIEALGEDGKKNGICKSVNLNHGEKGLYPWIDINTKKGVQYNSRL